MAWTILSAAQKVCHRYLCSSYNYKILSKVVLAQMARDESINHLIETMADVYSFVQEAESLKKIELHNQILLHMAQQTVECGYFIRDYARNKNFGMFFCLDRIRPWHFTIPFTSRNAGPEESNIRR
jgi:hypothetical protein